VAKAVLDSCSGLYRRWRIESNPELQFLGAGMCLPTQRNIVTVEPEQNAEEVPEDVAEHTTSRQPACPTPTAHKRLDEGHRWWHGCLANYDDPPAFRANLNACLQALRNVSWVLQKEHDLVPGFESWYPTWQETMKNDSTMRWLVKSRNRVVKSADLDLLSTATMRIVFAYSDVADVVAGSLPGGHQEVKKTIPLEARPPEYFKYVSDIPPGLRKQASLLIERRWVDKALPDWELLDALAHCYGVLSQMLDDAHKRVGGECLVAAASPDRPRLLDKIPAHEGRLPCMVTTLEARTSQYDLSSGALLGRASRAVSVDGVPPLSKLKRRYKLDEFVDVSSVNETIAELVDPLLSQAKKFLQKDKNHIFVVFLFKGLKCIGIDSVEFRDRSAKFAFSRELAARAAKEGITGLVTIGEVWQSKVVLDQDGVVVPPEEVPDRREALEVYAEDDSGQYVSKLAFFHRRFGRVIFDEDSENRESMENNFMAPIREVWRKDRATE
jgi:hypothetical protein